MLKVNFDFELALLEVFNTKIRSIVISFFLDKREFCWKEDMQSVLQICNQRGQFR